MQTLGLISFFVFSAIIISFFKNKVVRIVLSIFLGAFFVMQIMSLYLGGSFIDYRFYLHFNLNSLQMAGGYHKQILGTILILIITPIALYFIAAIKLNRFVKPVKFGLLFISLIIIVLPENSICHKLREIIDIAGYYANKNDNFEKILSNLEAKSEIPNSHFTLKENLKAEFGGKNIIILSLESFENAFLHDINADLAPNLRKLRNEWNFYEMQNSYSSGWTAGSLYTVFTGLPCFFSGKGNELFQGSNKSRIINLADFLNLCNYDSYHLSNNAVSAAQLFFYSHK
jgi:hypothetical protein